LLICCRVAGHEFTKAGQQQGHDLMQAGLLLLQSGVLQQVTLAQQQLAGGAAPAACHSAPS